MKKKIVSIMTAGIVAMTMLAGCGGSTGASSAPAEGAAEETAAEAPADGEIKIGVSIWSSTDVLGSQCKLIIDEAAKALGVQVQYVDQGHVSEKVTASVEQLCAAGCQGIIICNSSDTEMASAIKTCNDNKVYLAQFFRIINPETSADIYKAATDSEYYIGAVHENEPENGKKLVQILIDKGDRNIGLIGWEQGDATWLGRWEGYKAGVEEWNAAHPDDPVKLSEPQYAGTSSEGGSKAAEALMNADPTLDALIPAGGGGDPLFRAQSQLLSAQARPRTSTSFPLTSFPTLASVLPTVPWQASPADIIAILCSHSWQFTTQSRATTQALRAPSRISLSLTFM